MFEVYTSSLFASSCSTNLSSAVVFWRRAPINIAMSSRAISRKSPYIKSRPDPSFHTKPDSAFSQIRTCSRLQLTSHPSSPINPAFQPIRSRPSKLSMYRLKLQIASGCLAGISLAMSLGSCWLAGQESLASAIVYGVSSSLQVWLVIFYWRQEEKWVVLTSRALGTEISSRAKSRRVLCGLECLLHLLIPLSEDLVSLDFKVNTIAYTSLIFRNCHSFRWLYWISPLSSLRTNVFCSILNVGNLQWKAYLQRWSGVIAGLAILITWLLLDVLFDQETVNTGLTTLSRLGEGHSSTSKPYSRLALMILACMGLIFSGFVTKVGIKSMRLTHREAQLTIQLCKMQECESFEVRAAELLQAWWRLTQMRVKHRLNIDVVFTWYRTLLARRPLYRNARAGYCLYSHVEGIQKEMRAKIKRMQALSIFKFRIEAITRSEVSFLVKANYLAGLRSPILLSRRLSTIRESDSEWSSTVAHSPRIHSCFLP